MREKLKIPIPKSDIRVKTVGHLRSMMNRKELPLVAQLYQLPEKYLLWLCKTNLKNSVNISEALVAGKQEFKGVISDLKRNIRKRNNQFKCRIEYAEKIIKGDPDVVRFDLKQAKDTLRTILESGSFGFLAELSILLIDIHYYNVQAKAVNRLYYKNKHSHIVKLLKLYQRHNWVCGHVRGVNLDYESIMFKLPMGMGWVSWHIPGEEFNNLNRQISIRLLKNNHHIISNHCQIERFCHKVILRYQSLSGVNN